MKQTIKIGQYNISWIGSNFQKHFGDIKVSPKKVKLIDKILKRNMSDKEILEEFKPQEITLDQFVYALDKKKGLLTNGYANIFYIRDSKDIFWAVRAYWNSLDRCWGVEARSVGYANGWPAGNQFLSQAFGSNKLDNLALENRVMKLEQKMEKIQKFLILD